MEETAEVAAYMTYTANEAARDSIAGASLVAWPPSNYPRPAVHYPTVGTTQILPGQTDLQEKRGHVNQAQEESEERSDQVRTESYLALEAALDARRGACFAAWPTDEEWRVPTLCV